eukprot:CAMPEP_0119176932 /NCGR_PEP_ID=MMETSP1315-20130426/47201_1 /TAXON_ID=676789 /ORGANISM="Prasinoderma singularis, Strain RCC927" /LENGTH=39 /DNA_ID= /DNA_START= /DNA_END= /DNA_ORIENTATION=
MTQRTVGGGGGALSLIARGTRSTPVNSSVASARRPPSAA